MVPETADNPCLPMGSTNFQPPRMPDQGQSRGGALMEPAAQDYVQLPRRKLADPCRSKPLLCAGLLSRSFLLTRSIGKR